MGSLKGLMNVLLVSSCVIVCCRALRTDDIVIVVLSQSDHFHAEKADTFRQLILDQASSMQQKPPVIRLVHQDFPHTGAWTVIPLFPWLHKLQNTNSSWILFVEEKTRVNLPELVNVLSQFNEKEEIWMGHGLHDEEATIIHHFAFAENPSKFKYPLFAAGFAMSSVLLTSMKEKYERNPVKNSDFSIDASHELALYVGLPLLDLPALFCVNEQPGCVTYPVKILSCGEPVPKESIFFAVKTCAKFHKDRVPVVQRTWGQEAIHVEFFSHQQDPDIPTTAVGVRNTERGHCGKSFAIFRLVLERVKRELKTVKWVVLADDDTLLSVPRLQNLLSCWASGENSIVIGERYGYNVRGSQPGGFNYLTGGGGIVLGVSTLPLILQHCMCQGDDSPDDMFLGLCLVQLNIPLVHCPLFHQARPSDYAADYLAVQSPVSFHKHWMVDPFAVYRKWLAPGADSVHKHTEL